MHSLKPHFISTAGGFRDGAGWSSSLLQHAVGRGSMLQEDTVFALAHRVVHALGYILICSRPAHCWRRAQMNLHIQSMHIVSWHAIYKCKRATRLAGASLQLPITATRGRACVAQPASTQGQPAMPSKQVSHVPSLHAPAQLNNVSDSFCNSINTPSKKKIMDIAIGTLLCTSHASALLRCTLSEK